MIRVLLLKTFIPVSGIFDNEDDMFFFQERSKLQVQTPAVKTAVVSERLIKIKE